MWAGKKLDSPLFYDEMGFFRRRRRFKLTEHTSQQDSIFDFKHWRTMTSTNTHALFVNQVLDLVFACVCSILGAHIFMG